MKNICNYLILVLAALGSILLLNVMAKSQSNPEVFVKSGTGKITCSGEGQNIWTTQLLDFSDVEGGTLFIDLKLGDGKCAGFFFLKGEKETLPPQGKKQTASLGSRFPSGRLGIGWGTPSKIVLVGSGDKSSPAGSTNTFEYKAYVTGGKKVKGIPCDDPQIQTKYDKNALPYHEYSQETQICLTSNSKCSWKLVFTTMTSQIKYVVPETDSTLEVKNCMIFDSNIPGPFNADPIRIYIDEQNRSVTNYTRKGHIFHPGLVTRTIVEKGGAIYVKTYGEGTGKFPTPNQLLAPGYWKKVDNKLLEAVNQKLSKQ